jgi:hypothetical protein
MSRLAVLSIVLVAIGFAGLREEGFAPLSSTE